MTAIVYTSNSGFTKRYAELLGAEIGLPVYPLDEAKSKIASGAEILYMGWLMAGSVKSYPKAAKQYSVKAVCAVGMSRPSEKVVEGIKAKLPQGEVPVFYLQGGFNLKKLHGVYRLMMQIMAKAAIKNLINKVDRTEEENEMLELLKNGGDRVRPEYLSQVVAWCRGQA